MNSVRLKVYEDRLKATSNIKEPKQILSLCPRRDTDPDPKLWGALLAADDDLVPDSLPALVHSGSRSGSLPASVSERDDTPPPTATPSGRRVVTFAQPSFAAGSSPSAAARQRASGRGGARGVGE